jgi:hypothetical protein
MLSGINNDSSVNQTKELRALPSRRASLDVLIARYGATLEGTTMRMKLPESMCDSSTETLRTRVRGRSKWVEYTYISRGKLILKIKGCESRSRITLLNEVVRTTDEIITEMAKQAAKRARRTARKQNTRYRHNQSRRGGVTIAS